MEGRFLLDVVVRKSATILELLAGEDQTLLVRGDTLLVCKSGVSDRFPSGMIFFATLRLRGFCTYPGSWT